LDILFVLSFARKIVPVVRKRLKQRTGPGSIISAFGAEDKYQGNQGTSFQGRKSIQGRGE
jgi:hypothetical protein